MACVIRNSSYPVSRLLKKGFEQEYLRIKLTEIDGNISQTAQQAGLERSHLHKN